MINVIHLERADGICPYQAFGVTDDLRTICAHCRWGSVSLRLSDPGETKTKTEVFRIKWAGSMNYGKLRQITSSVALWPEPDDCTPNPLIVPNPPLCDACWHSMECYEESFCETGGYSCRTDGCPEYENQPETKLMRQIFGET